MKRIYDCVMFSHELDLLEIRLNTLAEIVDYFIVVELDRTHSGRVKEFSLEDEYLYTQFPIDYHRLHVPDPFSDPWALENQHRRYLQGVADRFSSDDVVIISDLDEIPNPEMIKGGHLGRYVQDMYYFYLNTKASYNWHSGTIVLPQWELMQKDIQELRSEGHSGKCTLPKVSNSGWHFSSVGTKEDVVRKINSFAHTEFDVETVLQHRDNLCDVHGSPLTVVNIDSSYPTYIQQNQTKYEHLIYE